MTAALTLEGVSKRYGDFQAVRDLSFEVEKGTICGFLGPNGAGKTSTIRMILGLQGVTAGRIGILGTDDGRKVRDRIEVPPDIDDAALEALALASSKVQRSLDGRSVRTVIVRAPRLVNVVPV